jgi:hypothetical protein
MENDLYNRPGLIFKCHFKEKDSNLFLYWTERPRYKTLILSDGVNDITIPTESLYGLIKNFIDHLEQPPVEEAHRLFEPTPVEVFDSNVFKIMRVEEHADMNLVIVGGDHLTQGPHFKEGDVLTEDKFNGHQALVVAAQPSLLILNIAHDMLIKPMSKFFLQEGLMLIRNSNPKSLTQDVSNIQTGEPQLPQH